MLSQGEAKHRELKDPKTAARQPWYEQQGRSALTRAQGDVQDKLQCYLPFCPVFSFSLPHSSRYSLHPFCFLSASCQNSSGISRGCSLASLSLHLIRRHPHLLCFCSPTWQSNLHFKNANSWVFFFFLCLKWAAQRVTLSGLAAAAVAQPDSTAERTPGKSTGLVKN